MRQHIRTSIYCSNRVQIDTSAGTGQPTEDQASSYFLASDYCLLPCVIKEFEVSAVIIKYNRSTHEETEKIPSSLSLYFYDSAQNYLGRAYKSGSNELAIDISEYPFITDAVYVRVSVYNGNSSSLYPNRQACIDSNYGQYFLDNPTTVEYTYQQWESDEEGFFLEDVEEAPEKPMEHPYPVSEWRIEGSNVTNALLPDYVPSGEGAFKYASELTDISIPRTVKYIGEEAFRYTALTRVKIAEDCVFFPTSFPEGCAIELNDTAEYGQLIDSNNIEILDCEAVRIYARGEDE